MADSPISFGEIRLTSFSRFVLDYTIVGAISAEAGKRGVRYVREELARSGINDTMALSRSIKSEVDYTALGPMYRVFSDEAMTGGKPVGRWVNEGTGIYGPYGSPIVSPTGGLMRFNPGKRSGGQSEAVYRSSVRGQPGTRFMDKALSRIMLRPLM